MLLRGMDDFGLSIHRKPVGAGLLAIASSKTPTLASHAATLDLRSNLHFRAQAKYRSEPQPPHGNQPIYQCHPQQHCQHRGQPAVDYHLARQ